MSGFSWNEKLIEGSFSFYKKICEAISTQNNKGFSSSTSEKDKALQCLDCDLDTPAVLRIIADNVSRVLDKDSLKEIPSIKELCDLINI